MYAHVLAIRVHARTHAIYTRFFVTKTRRVHRTNFSYVFSRSPVTSLRVINIWFSGKHVAEICSVYTTRFGDAKTDIWPYIRFLVTKTRCVHRTNFSYVFSENTMTSLRVINIWFSGKHVAGICSVYTTRFGDEKTDIWPIYPFSRH